MIVPIIIGVLTLFVLVAAFLATKYWHWAHVLVLVMFYFASVGYIVLASQSLSIRTEYQKKEKQALENLAKQEEGIEAILEGTDSGQIISRLGASGLKIDDDAERLEGLRDLEFQLALMSRERGRVWRNASPNSEVDPVTGSFSVVFPFIKPAPIEGEEPVEEEAATKPSDLGLNVDAVVYAFEQGPYADGERRYLGEFRVTEVNERQAIFEPLSNVAADPEAFERLKISPGPWIIYESMPIDRNSRFAGYSEEQLRAMLPPESVEEYLRDGTPQQPDDDPLRLEGLNADGDPVSEGEAPVSFRYRRMERAYTQLLKDYLKENTELMALIQASTADLKKLDSALKGAERLQAHREAEVSMLESDLEVMKREREAIESHLKMLQTQITKAERLLVETLNQNATLAARMERAQGNMTPVTSGALDIDAL